MHTHGVVADGGKRALRLRGPSFFVWEMALWQWFAAVGTSWGCRDTGFAA